VAKKKDLQLTIRGISPELAEAVRRLAREEGISLNKAAVRMLAKGANLGPHKNAGATGNDIDHLFGTWTESEAKAFFKSIEWCEQVDEDLWK
jgi:hypothetical protein